MPIKNTLKDILYMFGSNVRLRSPATKSGRAQFSSAQKFRAQVAHYHLDFKVQHLFASKTQKRNQGTLIETGRNRLVSRNQTAILAGLSKSSLVEASC